MRACRCYSVSLQTSPLEQTLQVEQACILVGALCWQHDGSRHPKMLISAESKCSDGEQRGKQRRTSRLSHNGSGNVLQRLLLKSHRKQPKRPKLRKYTKGPYCTQRGALGSTKGRIVPKGGAFGVNILEVLGSPQQQRINTQSELTLPKRLPKDLK